MDPNANQPQPVQPITPPPTPPHLLNLIKTLLISLTAVLILASIAGGVYFLAKSSEPKQVACTMEAKVCPDGTSVGRSGPKCEFAPCPTPTPDPTANWKTYRSAIGNFSLKYPNDWVTQGYQGSNLSFSENSDLVRFFSRQPSKDAVNGDYICVEFRINSNDNYQLKDGTVIANLDNGLKIYQRRENYAARESARAWLTDDKLTSLIDLPNGKKLLTYLEFNCTQGDLDSIRLSYEQQVQSQEYKQGLEIFKSISF